MLHTGERNGLWGWGPPGTQFWGGCRWVPSGSALQTLAESFGVISVTRNNAGDWTALLAPGCIDITAWAAYVENDTTHYHFAEVSAINQATRQVSIRHRSVAFASVASGPALSDTVDQMALFFRARLST